MATFCVVERVLPHDKRVTPRIIRFPPRIDITVDLHAPLAPTTRQREPRSMANVMSFRTGGNPGAYENDMFFISMIGPSNCGQTGPVSPAGSAASGYSWKTHCFINVYNGTRSFAATRSWYSLSSDMGQHLWSSPCAKNAMWVAQSAKRSKICVAYKMVAP